MAGNGTQKSRAWVWGLVAIAALVIAYWVFHLSRPEVTVRTSQVERQNLVSTISTNGKVEPVADFQAHAAVPSQVKRLDVHLGEQVRQGQPLLLLNPSDAQSRLAQAQANVASTSLSLRNMQDGGSADELLSAKADLATATQQEQAAMTTLHTLEALQARGSASAAEVAQARQRAADASARVAQLKARQTGRYTAQDLSTARAANNANLVALNAARSAYADVDVRAPFAGTVYSLPVRQYDFVPAGETLLNIADLSRLRVRAYFDEPEIGKLVTGQAVKIVWDAKPNLTWHGHIIQAPTTVITYGTRNVGEAIISVDDPDGQLLPNTNVTVTVTVSESHNVLSLPREALHTEGSKNFVYRIVDDHLVRTDINVGVVNLTRFEIVSGLNAGDLVALNSSTPNTDLADGMKARLQP